MTSLVRSHGANFIRRCGFGKLESRDASHCVTHPQSASGRLRLYLLVRHSLMKFSRLVCSVAIAVAGLAMTGQTYAGGGHGGHGGGHGGHGGGHGCFSGRHNGHDGGEHHGNHGCVSRGFYSYGYGYGYPYYYVYPYYYDYRAYPTVYRGYVANDYYALAVWVQKALARRGYYDGPIDGVIGKGTRRAIRGYRADYGLPVSSRIDDELLKALG